MKLMEILSKEIPKLPIKLDNLKGRISNKNWNQIGQGIQADVFHHVPTNKVIKLVSISGSSDPTYQFLRIALKHQNNPYFPRIYNIKKYGKEYPHLVVTLEKLHTMSDNDRDKYMKIVGSEYIPGERYTDLRSRVRKLWLDPQYRKQIFDRATDSNLKNALRLLEPLFKHYTPDMHFNNVMVRHNGQLVFIDPTSPS